MRAKHAGQLFGCLRGLIFLVFFLGIAIARADDITCTCKRPYLFSCRPPHCRRPMRLISPAAVRIRDATATNAAQTTA